MFDGLLPSGSQVSSFAENPYHWTLKMCRDRLFFWPEGGRQRTTCYPLQSRLGFSRPSVTPRVSKRLAQATVVRTWKTDVRREVGLSLSSSALVIFLA